MSRTSTAALLWLFVINLGVNLFAASRASGPLRKWWLAAALAAMADRAFTFAYFIPAMVGLMGATDSPASVAAATRWSDLNYVRLAILAIAWLASLKALSAFSEQRR